MNIIDLISEKILQYNKEFEVIIELEDKMLVFDRNGLPRAELRIKSTRPIVVEMFDYEKKLWS